MRIKNPPVEEPQLTPARVDLQRFATDGFTLDRGTLNPEQTRALPVQAHCDEAGFSGWTQKEGVDYVTPPLPVLNQVVALRVHLDDCGADNGALWVLPGSHARGLLTVDEVAELPRDGFVTCAANAGDVLLMRPLLVHRSSPAHSPTHRRVLHIVYAAAEPGTHVRWKHAIDDCGQSAAAG